MHILAVIMLHQHKFCVYKGKRMLKLLITCENCTFCALTVSILFCKYCFRKCVKKKKKKEKSLQSGGFREGRSGYSKHNFVFILAVYLYMMLSTKRLSTLKTGKPFTVILTGRGRKYLEQPTTEICYTISSPMSLQYWGI